jgi:cobalt-zinc-cadmium resistance protein CzcA
MLNRIIELSLRSRWTVVSLAFVIVGFGVWALKGLTIEAFPDPSDTQVNVITLYPGQPAEELERQVSIPIERALNGTPGLTRIRINNLFGLSFVSLTFADAVDVHLARAQILERIHNAKLPAQSESRLGSLSTPIGEIYRYTLESDTRDPLELRTLQDWVVAPRLLRVDGVADVVSFGGLVKEIQVRPDPAVLAARQLSMDDVFRALDVASKNASGGVVERGTEQLVIRSEGLFRSLEDIRDTAIVSRGGTPVKIRDVASVLEGWAPRQGIASRETNWDAVEGIVIMRRGENPSSVLARLRVRIDDINERVLRKGVSIVPFYDRTDLVNKTLETVSRNLLEGALLVVVVLYVFLLDLRAALIVATLIPLSLFSAFIYLRARGMSANLISMGAVDFGIIVDGAVVVIESIVHRVGHRGERHEPITTSIQWATSRVMRPTVFSLLIIIAAYVPLFLLERVEGRIFGPLAHTVVAALIGSLVLSVTLVPVLAAFAYRKHLDHRVSPVLAWSERMYRPALALALRHPLKVVAAAVLLLCTSIYQLAHLGTEFLPELNEGALYLTYTLPSNISLTEGRRLVPILDSTVRKFPQVETRLSQLGRPEDGTDPSLANNLEMFVRLKPMETWPKETPTLESVIVAMNREIVKAVGIEVNFSQPIRDNVNDNISGQPGQIALKIYAHDLKKLQAAAEKAKDAISKVRGVADLGILKSAETPQVLVRPRRADLGRFGIDLAEIQDFLATALGGKAAAEYWDGEKVFDVVLRLPEGHRSTVEDVSNLRIPARNGALIPLASVADVVVDRGRAAINRENGQRYIGVRMNVRGRDMGSFVNDAQKAVNQVLKRGDGLEWEWGGEFESKQRAMTRLLLVVPVAILLTFVLLFQAFGAGGPAFLVLSNVPFALVGGVFALWVNSMPFNISGAVGFIALVGQASLNGVLVLSAIRERRHRRVSLEDAISSGAVARLRPVLMTGALAALGLLPAAFSKAMGADTQRPIAVVIVGGTISAAILTLIVLPVSYLLLERLNTRMGWSKSTVTGDSILDLEPL